MATTPLHKRTGLLGEIFTILGISGQQASEARHSLEKASLSKVGHRIGILLQEEGKGRVH